MAIKKVVVKRVKVSGSQASEDKSEKKDSEPEEVNASESKEGNDNLEVKEKETQEPLSGLSEDVRGLVTLLADSSGQTLAEEYSKKEEELRKLEHALKQKEAILKEREDEIKSRQEVIEKHCRRKREFYQRERKA
jgi:hypothetical protein